ncbi:hypothetical protein Pfo_003571 [Paulownia fortunei]|nr:hypothetical protein Pfo_003571 [Paulownia fortunei]
MSSSEVRRLAFVTVSPFLYIEENYSKIRDVERELANLILEIKLTAGPKKAALELMRKKIEMSAERIHVAKLKEEQAKKFTTLENIRMLKSLEMLDISYNEIGAHSIDTRRYFCSSSLTHAVGSD